MVAGGSRPLAAGAFLTVAEVAAAMRVSTMTVYRLIKTGELAAVRVGHNYRIREDDLERYLTASSVPTRADQVEDA
ncbi:MAG TPA: helix-turn-helix domain-containing protein [Actinomycetota bacterium]|nr:helix-turn-helix domain-containing protein [Actinomycetota bacterium]